MEQSAILQKLKILSLKLFLIAKKRSICVAVMDIHIYWNTLRHLIFIVYVAWLAIHLFQSVYQFNLILIYELYIALELKESAKKYSIFGPDGLQERIVRERGLHYLKISRMFFS